MKTTSNVPCIIFAFATIFMFSSSVNAQEGQTVIEPVGTSSFSIKFDGASGVTQEAAGSRVMQIGCGLAREHGYTHLGVSYFEMGEHVQAVQTQRGQTTARMGADGRPTDIETTQDQYRAVRSGWATLNVIMMNRGGVEMLESSTDIIEVAGCTVQSRDPD